jgi:hypothetical protein
MIDVELMQSIKTKWGAQIDRVASSIPAAFFAALVANESGGNADAKRFEPAVLVALWQVLLGRKAAYGSIGAQDLYLYILPNENQIVGDPAGAKTSGAISLIVATAAARLDSLATSWGLIQIMGYEGIPFHTETATLQSPSVELAIGARMLSEFASRNGLDVTADFSELFDCWNTGRPHAQTADPQYIPNGLARMKIYEGLA